MKHNIDGIVNRSETEKSLQLRPHLWDNLERRLNNNQPKNIFKPWIAAASFLVIFTLSTLLYLNIDTYRVEDLRVTSKPYFSKEEISSLYKVHWVETRIFVNPLLG